MSLSSFADNSVCSLESLIPTQQIDTPADLFFHQLLEIHSMEIQLADSLPSLVGLASDRELRDSLSMHTFRTGKRAARLESIFASHDIPLGDTSCRLMTGLLEDGERKLELVGRRLTRDMMVVAHCQRIQHYGLAAYLIASRLAGCLDLQREVDLLESPKVEHQAAIRKLEAISSRLFGVVPVKLPSGGIYDTTLCEPVAV